MLQHVLALPLEQVQSLPQSERDAIMLLVRTVLLLEVILVSADILFTESAILKATCCLTGHPLIEPLYYRIVDTRNLGLSEVC